MNDLDPHRHRAAPYIPPTDASLDIDTQNFDDQFLAMEPNLVEEAPDTEGPEPSHEWHRAFDAYNFRDDQIVSTAEIAAPSASDRCESPAAVDPLDVPLPESPAPSTRSGTSMDAQTETPSESSRSLHTMSTSSKSDVVEGTAPNASPTAALLERIETIAHDDGVKASRHSRDLVRPPKPNADEDWDLLEGNSGYAYNGQREAGRGLIDRYRLAIIRRKESTVKRRASALVRRASGTSSTKTGDSDRVGLGHPPSLSTLRARLKGLAERRKEKRVPPPPPPVSGSGRASRPSQEANQE